MYRERRVVDDNDHDTFYKFATTDGKRWHDVVEYDLPSICEEDKGDELSKTWKDVVGRWGYLNLGGMQWPNEGRLEGQQ